MEDRIVRAMTKKVKVVTLHPVQLMVFGIIGQLGVPVQSLVVEGQQRDSAFAIHQEMEERIVKEMTKKVKVVALHPVQLMVFGIIGQVGVHVPECVEVEPKAEAVIVTLQEMEEMIVWARARKLSPVIFRAVMVSRPNPFCKYPYTP